MLNIYLKTDSACKSRKVLLYGESIMNNEGFFHEDFKSLIFEGIICEDNKKHHCRKDLPDGNSTIVYRCIQKYQKIEVRSNLSDSSSHHYHNVSLPIDCICATLRRKRLT